jgi:flavin-dependent dehydrogenase
MPVSCSVVVNEFDVIVIGGGPAGSAAAAFCAQRGFSVALIEHKKFPRHKVCGDIINPNCWPVLEELGVAQAMRALPRQSVRGARFTIPSGVAIDVECRGLEMVAIRRSLFDACLLDNARRCGVHVFESETAREITSAGHILTQRGRYLPVEGIIGADGRHSFVARKLDLQRAVRAGNGHVAFQAHFRAPAAIDERVELHLFAGGYCGIARVDQERLNLCIVTNRENGRLHGDVEALFARTVLRNAAFRELGIAPEPLEPLQSAYPLMRRMNQPCRDRVWLVGDALRTLEPFTGQGIFFALKTAHLASAAIAGGIDYAAAVRQLYATRSRTNALLRKVMYRQRIASAVIAALRAMPAVTAWLAGNVLNAEV